MYIYYVIIPLLYRIYETALKIYMVGMHLFNVNTLQVYKLYLRVSILLELCCILYINVTATVWITATNFNTIESQ
jgi:hypothetical protein